MVSYSTPTRCAALQATRDGRSRAHAIPLSHGFRGVDGDGVRVAAAGGATGRASRGPEAWTASGRPRSGLHAPGSGRTLTDTAIAHGAERFDARLLPFRRLVTVLQDAARGAARAAAVVE